MKDSGLISIIKDTFPIVLSLNSEPKLDFNFPISLPLSLFLSIFFPLFEIWGYNSFDSLNSSSKLI